MKATERTDTLAAPAARVGPLGVVLRAVGAKTVPPELHLRSGRCTVGAQRGSDLVLDSAAVSRQHLEVELVPEGVRLTDLGSRNGTFYLGQRIERAVLAPGSRVRVGDVELVFEVQRGELIDVPAFDRSEYRGLVGESAAMRRLFGSLSRLEGSLLSVLLEGESGVGKELVARAIHAGSSRAAKPFVALNCGALPRELFASELFGHVRGAFTGAADKRLGAFEQADGGTILLDEISELPLEMQPALLRVLEQHELKPVGADRTRQIDVRVLAASNRPLELEAAAGRFREDLYYRLAVVKLRVPPLRERTDDIPALAAALAMASGASLPPHVIEALKARRYPGNVRELRNVVNAYQALGELPPESETRPSLLDSVLSDSIDADRPYAEQKDELLQRFTRAYLSAVLHATSGNQTQAAARAGLSRTYLSELMAKLGLTRR